MRESLSLLFCEALNTMQGLALAPQITYSPSRPTANFPILAHSPPATLSCLQPPALQYTRLSHARLSHTSGPYTGLLFRIHLAVSSLFLHILQCQAKDYHPLDTFPDFCSLTHSPFLQALLNFSHTHVNLITISHYS